MQPKVKGLPQLIDDELTTPQHDKLCILLLNKDILKEYILNDKKIQLIIKNTIDQINYKGQIYDGWNKIDYETKYISHTIEVETPILEKVVKSNSGFIIGYIDVLVYVNIKIIYESITKDKKEIKETIKPFPLAIEVKTKIRSVGEVLRQLQTYKSTLGYHLVLVSNDPTNKEVFEGQGFSFWEVK